MLNYMEEKKKKASQVSAPSTDDLGNPAAAMEGTCFLRLSPVAIPPPPPATAVVLELPAEQALSKNQVAGNSK